MQTYQELLQENQALKVENAQLKSRVATLETQVAQLLARVVMLEAELAKARKDSSNSSKPPSSDIVKPPKPKRKKGKRRIGGQPGHPRHERKAFSPEEIDTIFKYKLDCCPDCGGKVKPTGRPPQKKQRFELVEDPVRVEEHCSLEYECVECGKIHYAPLPLDVEKGGLFSPRLSALVAYLKGGCHASYSTVQTFLSDVLGLDVSRGYLAKEIEKVSRALDKPYEELLAQLCREERVNVDETGHKENGNKFWTWCFRAMTFALFKIDPSRGSCVLIDVLGEEFNGVLGCDYFSAYRKYMKDFNVIVQFCLAHLIRDVKFLTKLPDRVTQNYGRRVLDGLRRLFRVIHRREKMSEEKFQKALERERKKLVATAKRAPDRPEAQNLAKRFRKHGDAYFRFITTPGVEPTNNLAEQAIRFVVIDRRVTQGTRSEAGRRWCERIWTVLATCAQQGRSAFNFIRAAVQSHSTGQLAPSFLDTS